MLPSGEKYQGRVVSADQDGATLEVEGAEPVSKRLGRVLLEVAERYPDLLSGVRLGGHCTLDPEELSARALRLPRLAEAAPGAHLGRSSTT